MKASKILFVMPDLSDVGYGVFLARGFQQLGLGVSIFPMTKQTHSHSPFKLALGKVRHITRLLEVEFKQNCRRLIRQQDDHKADLVVVIKCPNLPARVLKELHRTGPAIIQMNTDHPQMDPGLKKEMYLSALKEYDLTVTFARFLIPVFYQLGAKRVYRLPFAYDPEIHKVINIGEAEKKVFESPVVYLGAWGFFQQQWLEPLIPYGLKIFGGLWHNLPFKHPLGPCVNLHRGWGDEMAKACAGSQLVVNLMRAEHGCAHTMKTFEIPACGGFMLTNRTEEQKEFFREDKEAVYFDTQDELIEKLKYYLNHPQEREKIKRAAIDAVFPHTYQERARELLSAL